jgi:hypothetical protein
MGSNLYIRVYSIDDSNFPNYDYSLYPETFWSRGMGQTPLITGVPNFKF